MEFSMALGWLCLVAVLLLIEATTVNLVTIWFAIGALAAMCTSFGVKNLSVQLTVFIVVSTILVFATLPLVKKMRNKSATPLGTDRNIGRTAVVVDALIPGEQGRVRLDGVDWAATCATPLAVGESCRILTIQSTVLMVEAIPAPVTV